MREHHPLGPAGRARGVEDVGQVVGGAARGQRGGGVVGQDLVPGGVGRVEPRSAGVAVADDDQAGQGAGPGPGLARGRRQLRRRRPRP